MKWVSGALAAINYEYLKKGSLPVHLEHEAIKFSILGDNFNKPYELFLYLPDPTGRAIRSMGLLMICLYTYNSSACFFLCLFCNNDPESKEAV